MNIRRDREGLGSTQEQIHTMIADAVASWEHGEGVDGEEFFAKLEREERQLRGEAP